MSEVLSRRFLLKSLGLSAGGAAIAFALGNTAEAQGTPARPAAAGARPASSAAPAAPAGFARLDPKESVAVGFGYHEDATKVDSKKFPMHKPNQFCWNCLQFDGKKGEGYRPCKIIPKKLVAENGWCRVWLKKPGVA